MGKSLRLTFALAGLLALAGCGADGPMEITETEEDSWLGQRVSSLSDGPDATIYAIGIYEGGSNHLAGSHPTETVSITIAEGEGEPIQLALSSYEPVEWVLRGEGAKRVNRVYLDGYYRQSIKGHSGARVTNLSGRTERNAGTLGDDWGYDSAARSGANSISCAYTYPTPSGGGCEGGADFVANAEALLDAKVRSFAGIYNAQAFVIYE